MHKTKRPFSAIAIDHAHEQNNKVAKGDAATHKTGSIPMAGEHVWGQAHLRTPELPSPEIYGWCKSDTQG